MIRAGILKKSRGKYNFTRRFLRNQVILKDKYIKQSNGSLTKDRVVKSLDKILLLTLIKNIEYADERILVDSFSISKKILNMNFPRQYVE